MSCIPGTFALRRHHHLARLCSQHTTGPDAGQGRAARGARRRPIPYFAAAPRILRANAAQRREQPGSPTR